MQTPSKIILLLSLFFITAVHAQQKNTTQDSLTKAKEKVLNAIKAREPSVIAVYSLGCKRKTNTAIFGDYIAMEVKNLDSLLSQLDSLNKLDTSKHQLVLFVNGRPLKEISVYNVNLAQNKLTFMLDKYSKGLLKYYPDFKWIWSSIQVELSTGIDNGTPIKNGKKINLRYISNITVGLTLLFLILMFVSFLILAKETNLIRIGDKYSTYSLALSQLAFWSVVLAMSFIYIWAITWQVPVLSGSSLVLLSISISTTAGSRLVDKRRDSNATSIPASSGSFFKDILSDDLGYSVHRCQMFLWTIILGVIFIRDVVILQMIPQIDESLLGLMGISSGAYIGLKMSENNKTQTTPETKEEK